MEEAVGGVGGFEQKAIEGGFLSRFLVSILNQDFPLITTSDVARSNFFSTQHGHFTFVTLYLSCHIRRGGSSFYPVLG